MRILVVDDEEPVREVLSRRLQAWGHEVVTAASAEQALEQMRLEPAAVVFCDIIMPGQNGIWLMEQIRKNWPATAVVMVSCAEGLPTVMKAKQLGAVDYVPKPVGREMLHQALERAFASLSTLTA